MCVYILLPLNIVPKTWSSLARYAVQTVTIFPTFRRSERRTHKARNYASVEWMLVAQCSRSPNIVGTNTPGRDIGEREMGGEGRGGGGHDTLKSLIIDVAYRVAGKE